MVIFQALDNSLNKLTAPYGRIYSSTEASSGVTHKVVIFGLFEDEVTMDFGNVVNAINPLDDGSMIVSGVGSPGRVRKYSSTGSLINTINLLGTTDVITFVDGNRFTTKTDTNSVALRNAALDSMPVIRNVNYNPVTTGVVNYAIPSIDGNGVVMVGETQSVTVSSIVYRYNVILDNGSSFTSQPKYDHRGEVFDVKRFGNGYVIVGERNVSNNFTSLRYLNDQLQVVWSRDTGTTGSRLFVSGDFVYVNTSTGIRKYDLNGNLVLSLDFGPLKLINETYFIGPRAPFPSNRYEIYSTQTLIKIGETFNVNIPNFPEDKLKSKL